MSFDLYLKKYIKKMGRSRIFRNKERFPYSDKNCTGGEASPGLRRKVKDGLVSIGEAWEIVMLWESHERKNGFCKWLRGRQKRLKKGKK